MNDKKEEKPNDEHEKGPCTSSLSEFKFEFGPPAVKKPPTTRTKLMEKFLWHEFYQEYIRNNNELGKPVKVVNCTEYFDEYCKHIPPIDPDLKSSLSNKYPVYCTTAITVWNHNGEATKTFKKKYSITMPLEECSEKFGP